MVKNIDISKIGSLQIVPVPDGHEHYPEDELCAKIDRRNDPAMNTDQRKYMPAYCEKCGSVGTIVEMGKCCLISRMNGQIVEEKEPDGEKTASPNVLV